MRPTFLDWLAMGYFVMGPPLILGGICIYVGVRYGSQKKKKREIQ